MLVLRGLGHAGPSRLRQAPTVLLVGIRYASSAPVAPPSPPPRRRVRPAQPARPVQPVQPVRPIVPPPAPQSPAVVAEPDKKRGDPVRLIGSWPWHVVSNEGGIKEEERVIFARPFELGRPKMYWWALVVSGLFAAAWVIAPPPPRVEEPETEEEHANDLRSVMFSYAASGAVATTVFVSVLFLTLPSRFITRLSQVRQHLPNGQQRTFLRMQHGGHLMWGEGSSRAKPRELAKESVHVRMLANPNPRSPYLSLTVKPRQTFLDRLAYRVNFGDSPALREGEKDGVVLSLNRVEHVFGKL